MLHVNRLADIKTEIAKRLESAYDLFKTNIRGADCGSGSYSGTMKQFESQYTIGHELCIWANSSLDLTPYALSVAKGEMPIKRYFDIFFLSYFQPIANKGVHVLYLILQYMINNCSKEIEKDEITKALGIESEKEDINALCNFLSDTSYIKYEGKKLVYVGKEKIDIFINRCNIQYLGTEGLIKAKEELDTDEKYIKYIMSGDLYSRLTNDDYNLEENSNMVAREPRTNKMFGFNTILYGAPGTGKTYATAEYALAIINNKPVENSIKTDSQRKIIMDEYNSYVEKGQIVFTTFHQSYGYEDFVQGLRPDTSSDKLKFDSIDGVFKQIADKAMLDTKNNYVIIIDEINRANISKVFGELITLIEEDKRWGELNAISVNLPSGQPFAIPNNLYIIGTMNSADKSISLIDTALRRRFEFIEVTPNYEVIQDKTLKSVLEKLNQGLVDELDSTDLLIGHAYFIGKTSNDLCQIMNNSIIPLLYEYFYDNAKKVKDQINYNIFNNA